MIQKRYPTAVLQNPGTWVNPNNALNAEDDLCATKNSNVVGDYIMQVGTWGFAIPAGSIINSVKWTAKMCKTGGAAGQIEARLNLGFSNKTIFGADVAVNLCSNSAYGVVDDVSGWTWTVDKLNGDLMTVYFTLDVLLPNVLRGQVDAVYIEVDYTPPPSFHGDGLHWVG